MKIAILGGTGSIGEGFALRWASKHDIIICSRDVDRAIETADKYSGTVLSKGLVCCGISGCTNETGIEDVDVVVLSVPYKGMVPLLQKLKPFFNNQIVISLVVPMQKNDKFEYTPPEQGSAALEIKEILPETVKVISAYHNISARKLADLESNLDYDVVICGDDEDAKKTVMELTHEINNLRPLDGGGLESSYMIESLTPFLINLAIKNGLRDLGVKFL
ncbi:MAG: NADPH-dependent F420 reductase [Candidatus Methanoperedenaceae archaeon]|nr:NADPH-dependent F420 reductase [Candidatus Methanoperedenaceae archaeon]